MRIELGSLLTVVLSTFPSLVLASNFDTENSVPTKNNVEISLSANWNQTPFKLNVIEAVSNLNSSLHETLVLKLLNIEIDNESGEATLIDDNDNNENENSYFLSDEEFYNYALSLLPSDLDKSLVDLDISNKIMSPKIQAHYQYYESKIKSIHNCEQNSVFFDSFGEEFYCEQDAAYMLRTVDYAMTYENIQLPFDRLIGSPSSTSVIYVIYGDYTSKYFRTMFFNLYQFTLSGKLNIIWRYVPPQNINNNNSNNSTTEVLSGYGAALNLKRTDYIAIDDRGFTEEQQKKISFDNKTNQIFDDNIEPSEIFKTNFSDIQPVNQENLTYIGLKFTKFINDSREKLSDLINLVSEFPKYARFISKLNYSNDELEKIASITENSYKSYIPTGIYINNAVITPQNTDIFQILKVIKRELSFNKLFKSIGLEYKQAQDLMIGFSNEMLNLFRSPSRRYDLSKFVKTIVYLNDIEKDSRFQDFKNSKEAYQKIPDAGTLPNARENIHEVIFVIDITNSIQLSYLLNFYDQIFNQKIPIRIGVIPLLETSRWNDYAVSKLFGAYHDEGPIAAYNYLSLFNRFVSSKEPVTLMTFRALDFPYLDDSLKFRYTDNLPNLFKTFDIKNNNPMIISNGIFFDFNDIDNSLDQIFEDMMYIFGSLRNKKIPSNMSLTKFLRKDSVKIRNNKLIPDKISQYKNNFLNPPNFVSCKHWQSIDLFRIIREPYKNEALVTINLLGSLMDEKFIKQVIEIIKYSSKAKGIKIVISDIHATIAFKELIMLNNTDDQLKFLEKLSSSNIQDDFLVRDTHMNINDMFGIDYRMIHDINMIIAGRKITIKDVLTSDVISSIVQFERSSRLKGIKKLFKLYEPIINVGDKFDKFELYSWITSYSYFFPVNENNLEDSLARISLEKLPLENTIHTYCSDELLDVQIIIDPITEEAQELISYIPLFAKLPNLSLHIHLRPKPAMKELPIKRFYKGLIKLNPFELNDKIIFSNVPEKTLFNVGLNTPQRWMVAIEEATTDLDNLKLDLTNSYSAYGEFILKHILVEGYAIYYDGEEILSPAGLPIELIGDVKSDTNIMANFGYFQLKANPGMWELQIKPYTKGSEIYNLPEPIFVGVVELDGTIISPIFEKNWGMESVNLIEPIIGSSSDNESLFSKWYLSIKDLFNSYFVEEKKQADINIFTVASGHLYERFLGIMIASVMKQTTHSVKFWLIENYMSPNFKKNLPKLAIEYGFQYELIMYNWPLWLNSQRERQRTIWGYKILFLDVLFPQDLKKVIFVDSDQIIRTDLKELIDIDLHGAPYGYTPMGDSREEMEGFRFWKTGYWEKFLGDEYNYHISALYVVDLERFRKIAAGDILRHQYQQLSYDPNSLSNLDQDLPNNLQTILPIYSLPQEWLWCETWCSDESLKDAKTIDLCNNPLTKEPKLDRARRQIKEWVDLDTEVSNIISGIHLNKSELEHDEL